MMPYLYCYQLHPVKLCLYKHHSKPASQFPYTSSQRHSSRGRLNLDVVGINLLLRLEILQDLNAGKTKTLVDPHHAQAISFGNAIIITTEEDIQLLKCLVLGLRGKLPNEQTTQSTEDGEEDIGTILHCAQHILGGKTNNEVEHPVGGSDDRDTAGALTVGEDFLSQYPSDGACSIKC